tara:strand:- start:1312 stop:2148 length:837 start_codon:yes stop_codon:yes gene_type:complete
MSDPVHILSLGAGVQSSTLALMAAKGLVTPMPQCAIFADTQAEPPSVYRWLEWLEKQLPFPVHRVTAGSLTERITTTKINRKTGQAYYSNMIPAFSENADGTTGITGRACTFRFKIEPIQKAARRIGGIKRGQKSFGVVQWIGISLDEVSRMKDSREPWIENRWPLIEMRMKRHDCLRWMEANGYPTPPRSACSYCPFHSDAEWRRLKAEEPAEFAKAVKVERMLQAAHASVITPGKKVGTAFLHNSLLPLDQVDFSTEEENGQTSLFQNECEGMCGV